MDSIFSQLILGSSLMSPASGRAGQERLNNKISPPPKNLTKPKQAGKKEGGLGEGIFARLLSAPKARQGWEAARPCVSKEAKPAKIVSLIEKEFCARPLKEKEIFAGFVSAFGGVSRWAGLACEARHQFRSKKVRAFSNKGHQNQTFRFFRNHFLGGRQCRPLIFWLAAQSAARQKEVRAKDFFGSDLFRKKVAIPCDFSYILCVIYPFLHRFEPIILLLFKPGNLFLQRLFLGKQFCFFSSVDFSFNILL